MSKSKDMLGALAEMRKKAVEDDPHHQQTSKDQASGESGGAGAKPALSIAKPVEVQVPKSKQPRKKKDPADTDRKNERATIIFTPSASDALMQLQAFLMNDCGLRATNASLAANIALELTAERLKSDKARLIELVEARKQADGRRKAS